MEAGNGAGNGQQSDTPAAERLADEPINLEAGEGAAAEPAGAPPKPKVVPLERGAVVAQLAELKTAGVSRLLGAKDILDAEDFTYTIVEVPEWAGSVVVRSGSGTERDAFEASLVTFKGKQRITNTNNIRAKLCRLAIVDPADPELRKSLFDDRQIMALGRKSAAALDRVYDAAARLWGLSNDDVEELAKNSEGAGSAG